MSQLRNVFSGLAQSCTKPTSVPKPPLTSSTDLIRFTRSSGVPIVAAALGAKAVFSIASSGSLNAVAPGRCNVPTTYSLWCRMSPWRASAIAFSRVSAICQLSSTRHSLRSTVVPCFFAALSAKPHCVDTQGVRVGGKRARAGPEDRPSAAHPVELHHALRDIERVVIGQRDDAGRELDPLRPLRRRGEKHLGRADHLPAARMVLAAP